MRMCSHKYSVYPEWKFDGNPMNYYNFVAVFNECVDKQISDCQTKLIRLFQFTTGDAKNAIRACVSTGGSKGYADARAILKNRFGNDHLVCATLLNLSYTDYD